MVAIVQKHRRQTEHASHASSQACRRYSLEVDKPGANAELDGISSLRRQFISLAVAVKLMGGIWLTLKWLPLALRRNFPRIPPTGLFSS